MTSKPSDNSAAHHVQPALDGKALKPAEHPSHVARDAVAPNTDLPTEKAEEFGGQAGLEPTRYGDWEKKGRCTDF